MRLEVHDSNGNLKQLAMTASSSYTSLLPLALSGTNGSFTYLTATFGNSNGLLFYSTNGSIVGSYTVPGIVNISLSGNTSGTLTLISSGTAILAGGNNITLSQNGQSVTISAFNQTVQTQNLIDVTLAGNTTGTMALVSSGTLQLAGGNNITLSQSGTSNITISAANQTVQTQNLIDVTLAGNTTGTMALVSSGTLQLAGGNNITLSQSGTSNITISAANQTVQTQNLIDVTLAGNTTGTMALVSSGTLQLAGGNNITLSQSGTSNITISAANQTVQTQNLFDLTAAGNTTGTLVLVSSGTLTLAGGNNITLSQGNNNAITISAFTQTVQTQNLIDVTLAGNTSGTMALISSGTMQLAGGNNITLSQSGTSNVTISAMRHDVTISGNTAGVLASISSGTWTLAGGNAITLSQAGNAVTISGPNATLSSFEPYPMHNTGTSVLSNQTNTSGAASFFPYTLDNYVAARHANVILSMNLVTGGTSSFRQSITMSWGLYTRQTGANSTQLSVFTSNSLSIALTYNNSSITISQATTTNDTGYAYSTTASAGVNISSQYTGLKLAQLLLLTTLPPNQYWLGIMDRQSFSSFSSGLAYSYLGNANTLGSLAPIGSLSSAYSSGTNLALGIGGQWPQLLGSYSAAAQTALPNAVSISSLQAPLTVIPYMSLATTA